MDTAKEQSCITPRKESFEWLSRKDSSDGKRCDIYYQICEQSKLEAAKQTSHLLQTAETLCNENSETSKRKGMVYKKLASQVERHVFDSLQKEVCEGLWAEAAEQVYGTSECKLTKDSRYY